MIQIKFPPLSAKTVSPSVNLPPRWIATGTIPYAHRKRQRASLIDPYKPYLVKRWQQGCHKGAQLERELRSKGYKGSVPVVYRYLQTLKALTSAPSQRKSSSKPASRVLPNPLLTLSVREATWLFFRKEADMKLEEQETLRQLRLASPDLEATYQLVEAFLQMVRKRTGEQLEEWLGKVTASHLQAFQPFVTGVQTDKDAVQAGLTLPWSNGPLEGHVNRLKLIKRSMYGRAEFDLLRLRVLHQDQKGLERKNKRQKKAQQGDNSKTSRSRKKNLNAEQATRVISKVA
jgi:transposase